MTGKYAPPEVTIQRYPDSPTCDVVVVVRGREMVHRCRNYRQAVQWARMECRSYKLHPVLRGPTTLFHAQQTADDRRRAGLGLRVDLEYDL
jgi:hypothetical protein